VTAPDVTQYGWWLAARASGIVALVLVTVAVGAGLAMAGRVPRRKRTVRALLGVHEHAALAGLAAIAVHAGALAADPWLRPGLTGVTVPLAIGYRPAATALGIVAAYAAALLGLSYYVGARIGPRTWRRLHRATVIAWALAVAHAVTAGTDATTPWLRGLLAVAVAPVVALLLWRTAGRTLAHRVGVRLRPSVARGRSGVAAEGVGRRESIRAVEGRS
jgi:methionine sulfoxide reductase heme-binding subunit